MNTSQASNGTSKRGSPLVKAILAGLVVFGLGVAGEALLSPEKVHQLAKLNARAQAGVSALRPWVMAQTFYQRSSACDFSWSGSWWPEPFNVTPLPELYMMDRERVLADWPVLESVIGAGPQPGTLRNVLADPWAKDLEAIQKYQPAEPPDPATDAAIDIAMAMAEGFAAWAAKQPERVWPRKLTDPTLHGPFRILASLPCALLHAIEFAFLYSWLSGVVAVLCFALAAAILADAGDLHPGLFILLWPLLASLLAFLLWALMSLATLLFGGVLAALAAVAGTTLTTALFVARAVQKGLRVHRQAKAEGGDVVRASGLQAEARTTN